MKDIDRTFLKLKRKPFLEVMKQLKEEGKVKIVADPLIFVPVAKIKIEDLEATGWSVNEITDLMESQLGCKITIEDDCAAIREIT